MDEVAVGGAGLAAGVSGASQKILNAEISIKTLLLK